MTEQIEIAKILGNSPESNKFWCNDGSVFSNLRELSQALKKMSKETYSYHANVEKNDFSNWVNDIFGDEKLASQLINAKTQKAASSAIDSRLAKLKIKRSSSKKK